MQRWNRTYTGSDDSISISEPDDPRTLDPAVAIRDLDRLRSSTGIKDSDLLIPRGLQRVRNVRDDDRKRRRILHTVARRLPV
jgi:hypothetical protein